MKLKNVLIVVKDIEKSKKFYHDLFGLDVVLDNGGNVILTEGLVLQDRKIWESFLEKEVIFRNNSTELYFEEYDLGAFVEKLEWLYPRIQYVNKLMTYSWGQKVVRFYDPDYNRYLTWLAAHEDIEKQRDSGFHGEKFLVLCGLYDKNKNKFTTHTVIAKKYWEPMEAYRPMEIKNPVDPEWEYRIRAVRLRKLMQNR